MRDLTPSCPERVFEKAPLRTSPQTVQSDWIDYNGHMNVAYYTLAFDKAFDEVLEDYIGIGESFVARAHLGPMSLQSQYFYVGELMEGEQFYVDAYLLDCDAKRMHFFGEMYALKDGRRAAAFESMSLNVDLEARKSAPYPEFAQARLEALRAAQADLPRPAEVGQTIGIRRKG
ncbi:MAG: thioesterase family protein [Pseudomonadota bacterium]